MKAVVPKSMVFLAASVLVVIANALPPLPAYVEQHYAAMPEHGKFLEMYRGLEMEHKCDSCHKPNIDKKTKGHGLNDYGQVVHKHFKHRDFNKADKLGKNDPEQAAIAQRLISDALRKADEEKNGDGKAYGELIKLGRLPGKN